MATAKKAPAQKHNARAAASAKRAPAKATPAKKAAPAAGQGAPAKPSAAKSASGEQAAAPRRPPRLRPRNRLPSRSDQAPRRDLPTKAAHHAGRQAGPGEGRAGQGSRQGCAGQARQPRPRRLPAKKAAAKAAPAKKAPVKKATPATPTLPAPVKGVTKDGIDVHQGLRRQVPAGAADAAARRARGRSPARPSASRTRPTR